MFFRTRLSIIRHKLFGMLCFRCDIQPIIMFRWSICWADIYQLFAQSTDPKWFQWLVSFIYIYTFVHIYRCLCVDFLGRFLSHHWEIMPLFIGCQFLNIVAINAAHLCLFLCTRYGCVCVVLFSFILFYSFEWIKKELLHPFQLVTVSITQFSLDFTARIMQPYLGCFTINKNTSNMHSESETAQIVYGWCERERERASKRAHWLIISDIEFNGGWSLDLCA